MASQRLTKKRWFGVSRISPSVGKKLNSLLERPVITVILKITPHVWSVKLREATTSVVVEENAPH